MGTKEWCLWYVGFPGGSDGKESAFNGGGLGTIPGLGRSPGERNGYPLQYCGLKNFMGCIVHWVTKSLKKKRFYTCLVVMIWRFTPHVTKFYYTHTHIHTLHYWSVFLTAVKSSEIDFRSDFWIIVLPRIIFFHLPPLDSIFYCVNCTFRQAPPSLQGLEILHVQNVIFIIPE